MAATFVYKVKSLKTDPNDDNYIKEATVEIFGTEGSVTKSTSCHCVFPGNKAAVGSDFKSLEDLKKEDGESIIVGWIKVGIMDYKVAKIEKAIQNAIDIHNTKVIETTVNSADTSYSAQPTETPTPSE